VQKYGRLKMKDIAKKILGKQHYKIIGKNSVVKLCTWCKKDLVDKGECYKSKFYGITSSRCCQMSPNLICSNACIMCWRSIDSFTDKKIKEFDDPKDIIDNAIKAQRILLNGFPGNEKLNKNKFEEAQDPKHFAISLIGEPLMYPKMNELIEELKKKNITSFVVTNGQFPNEIKNLKEVTQLYLSLDAPNEILLKKIDKSLFKDCWGRLNESLIELSKRKDRTCIRLTMIKDLNMCNEEEYADLIKKGNPDFVEVKAYMHLGRSREFLEESNMPYFEDIEEFSKKLKTHLKDYEIINEHKQSRVILLGKNKNSLIKSF
jgi:tRNA wybutosine-synthesizing protein 1